MFVLDRIFLLLGRVLFPRRQRWEQIRNAKLWTGVALFTAVTGVVLVP